MISNRSLFCAFQSLPFEISSIRSQNVKISSYYIMFAKTNVILKQSKYHLYCQNNIVNLKYSIASRQGLKYFIFHFIYMRFRKRPPSFHRNFREYPLRVILFCFVICDICCKSFVFLPFKFVVAFIEKRQPEAIGTRVEKGRLKTCRNLLAYL